jgi:hypothetical protein
MSSGGSSGGNDAGSGTDSGTDAGTDASPDPCSPTSCSVDSDGDGIPDWVEGRCAAGGATDGDTDGTPDYLDLDSDADGILDSVEWRAGGCDPTTPLNDVDGDGVPNFRDTDSDGDGVPDKCEARGKASPPPTDLSLPVLDIDGDGKLDFLDIDSDGDLLTDGLEDRNANCVVDACETDRLKKDTDGDGVDDFIETTLAPTGTCWATDGSMTPAKAGIFYILEPYSSDGSAKPSPTKSPLGLSTTLNKGDVGLIVDTTSSMGGEITALRTSLSSTIIPALKAKIPSLAVGVAAHDDFPYGTYGSAGCLAGGDFPVYLAATPQGYATTVTADSQTAANALAAHCGGDGSESQLPAIYHALTGSGITWPAGSVAAVTPPVGTFGAIHFRSDALPIVVEITDTSMHNGKRALDKTGASYDTTAQDAYSFSTWTADDVVTKINALGAKYIGVACDNGTRGTGAADPYGYHAFITDKTSSNVPPSAFVGGTCNTGVSGAAVAVDGPTISGVKQCRSVYSVNTSGTGLSTSIVDGVVAIFNSVKFDVYGQAYNDVAETTDVVGNFMQKVEPNPLGGTDPTTGRVCVTFPGSQLSDYFTGPKALLASPDGVSDTARGVNPGGVYCFDLTPKPNTTVPRLAAAQVFKAWIRVLAIKPTGGTFALGSDRQVVFIVPPIVS